MNLNELIRQLENLRSNGLASPESPVIIEGHDAEDNFIQGSIESVMTERRCEDDDEPQGVYINLEKVSG